VRSTVVVGGRRPLAAVTLDGVRSAAGQVGELPELDPQGQAMVAFTSGSTGPPKGVVYRRDQLAAQLEAVAGVFGWCPGDVDMPTMPLFALFGVALGLTVVLPPMDFTRPAKVDPAMLARLIEEYQVRTMFGSPALLNTLSRWASEHGARLESLRRVVTAGAPAPAALLSRCRAMLSEDAEVCIPYGATEALPATIIESREILKETAAATDSGAGVCVGRAVPGAEIEIIQLRETPISSREHAPIVARGEIGEIVVRAPWVSVEYLNDASNTARAKIAAADGSVWHRTGDAGYQDADGRVWFCGRVGERVVTEGETLFTVPCEAVFDTHPAVFRSALVGPRLDGRPRPTICVELEPGARKTAELCEQLLELAAGHEHTRSIRRVLVHPGFPVDVRHNSKIERETLTKWAQKRVRR
jgi:acyl-CoA synthetase (AMP-forming)/AMP-acid ligase II